VKIFGDQFLKVDNQFFRNTNDVSVPHLI
jgi:hypothetical protein